MIAFIPPRLKSPLKALPIARLRGQKLRPRRGTLGKAFKNDFESSKIFGLIFETFVCFVVKSLDLRKP